MSAFFQGITKTVPSLFRGIFAEGNSVPNPSLDCIGGSEDKEKDREFQREEIGLAEAEEK
jgi:hypothetical protein